jgi:regulator of protease activity HflC (stomatin/prohibitin superfamily)
VIHHFTRTHQRRLVIFRRHRVRQTINVVPQQHAWVVERLGKYHATLAPGLNIVVPFVDRIAYKHSLKEIPLDVPPQVCITQGQHAAAGRRHPVLPGDGRDARVVRRVELHHRPSPSWRRRRLRSVIGKMELDKTFEERDHINTTIVNAIDESAANWGVKVLRYEIKDLTPPAEILHSMQRQITAEREKRALIAASEGRRQEAINIASGEREAAIARSEGEKQAAINRAQGEAAAIVALADASASALRQVGEAIRSAGRLRRRQPARRRRVRARVRQPGQDQQLDHRAGRPGRHERPDRVGAARS